MLAREDRLQLQSKRSTGKPLTPCPVLTPLLDPMHLTSRLEPHPPQTHPASPPYPCHPTPDTPPLTPLSTSIPATPHLAGDSPTAGAPNSIEPSSPAAPMPSPFPPGGVRPVGGGGLQQPSWGLTSPHSLGPSMPLQVRANCHLEARG